MLVYYPPYHSKYNPIERLWGILENYWRGELLDSEAAVLGYAVQMTYNGVHPQVRRCSEQYPKGVKLTKAQRKRLESRLHASRGWRSGRLRSLRQPRTKQLLETA